MITKAAVSARLRHVCRDITVLRKAVTAVTTCSKSQLRQHRHVMAVLAVQQLAAARLPQRKAMVISHHCLFLRALFMLIARQWVHVRRKLKRKHIKRLRRCRSNMYSQQLILRATALSHILRQRQTARQVQQCRLTEHVWSKVIVRQQQATAARSPTALAQQALAARQRLVRLEQLHKLMELACSQALALDRHQHSHPIQAMAQVQATQAAHMAHLLWGHRCQRTAQPVQRLNLMAHAWKADQCRLMQAAQSRLTQAARQLSIQVTQQQRRKAMAATRLTEATQLIATCQSVSKLRAISNINLLRQLGGFFVGRDSILEISLAISRNQLKVMYVT